MERILQQGRVYIWWNAFKVHEFDNVVKCFKCYDFGYMSKECKNKERVCRKCGKSGHEMKAEWRV